MSNEQYDYVPRYPDDRQPSCAAIVFLPLAILALILVVSTLHSVSEVILGA